MYVAQEGADVDAAVEDAQRCSVLLARQVRLSQAAPHSPYCLPLACVLLCLSRRHCGAVDGVVL